MQIKAALMHAQFQSDRDVVKPVNIENTLDQEVKTSGGELRRVAIVLALGKPNRNVYLINEPSSSSCVFFWSIFAPELRNFRFLDPDQHIIAAKGIKRFILHAKKTAFVIEPDFIMATYLADHVIVFGGTTPVAATATSYVFCCPCLIHSKRFDWVRITANHNCYSRGRTIPPIIGNNVPPRPGQLPPTCELT